MKNIKISSFIFILITIFLVIDFIGYRILHNHIISDHEKDTKILFHEIKSQTSDLLSKLLVEYSTQKEQLKNKHKIVFEYMNRHDLNVNLEEIQQKINKGHPDKPYNIYITDKDLVIRNTTYKNDIGFDLSFAKNAFEKHKAENSIGCSAPIREKISKNFLSFTDSYLSKNSDERSAVLQVSYTYQDTTQELVGLQEIINKNLSIKDIKAYSISSTGYIYEIVLHESDVSYKPTIQSKIISREKAISLAKKLFSNDFREESFKKENIPYKLLCISANSHIEKDMKIIYTILLDESILHDRLKNLDILMILISLMGVIGIFIISKMRGKEVRLSEQDKFVQSAMHEIKTPLSIITLNNELRQLEQGTDSYSEEIDNALKVLHNSYRSMSFIMTKDKLTYRAETLDLSQIVKERIEYFQTIAEVNDKKIIFDINSHCRVNISLIELTRLIDNSLYNAIKYSAVGSDIEVILDNNRLSFHNQGKAIANKEKVFNKYFRENKTVGGYGLGLSIIKDIADKYDIGITLQSDTHKGTIFTYVMKCHTGDISQE